MVKKIKTCSLDKFLIGKCEQDPHKVKLFIKFLYKHKAYGIYVFNYINAVDFWKKEYHIESSIPNDFIIRAFLWGKTPQGYDYWKNLNNLWCDFLHIK